MAGFLQIMRVTQEGHTVQEHQLVWEIVYEYINPEVSWAVPENRCCAAIPRTQPIYFRRYMAKMHADQLNKLNHPFHSELKLLY